MKTLLLIRHAKAETDFILDDFDRSLTERGKADALNMANRLLTKKIAIDAFISSPAKRTKKTAKIFCKTFGMAEENIYFADSLYLAPPREFFKTTNDLNNTFNTVAIVAHNSGISDFANSLIKNMPYHQMPTCGIFAVNANINNWVNFANAQKEFLFFDMP